MEMYEIGQHSETHDLLEELCFIYELILSDFCTKPLIQILGFKEGQLDPVGCS